MQTKKSGPFTVAVVVPPGWVGTIILGGLVGCATDGVRR